MTEARDDGTDYRLIPPGVYDARSRAIIRLAALASDDFDLRKLLVTDIDTVDARLLPFLVRAWSVQEFVMEGMPETLIRTIIKNSIPLHIGKGKVAGVKFALSLFGATVRWTQWHAMTPRGAPNTYDATIFVEEPIFEEETILTPRHITACTRIVAATKRHSQEGALHFGLRQTGTVFVHARHGMAHRKRLPAYQPTLIEARSDIAVGIVQRSLRSLRLNRHQIARIDGRAGVTVGGLSRFSRTMRIA